MIILDGIALALRQRGGIATYFRELAGRMPALRQDARIWLYSSDPGLGALNGTIQHKSYRVLERYRSPSEVPPGAIFHSSYYRVAAGARNVVTVYDFIYERFTRGLRRAAHMRQKRQALDRADAIICISHSTKEDLLQFHPHVPATRVHVIHLAASDCFSPLPPTGSSPREQPFVLYVGGRGGYKNFESAVHGTARVSGLRLVCAGGGPFTPGELRVLNEVLPGRHEHVGPVGKSELNRLYNQAFCLLYPSRYEGFGIPVVEAQAAGCPVITSSGSSMGEVAGQSAVLLSDPTQDAIAAALRLLEAPRQRAEYSRLGLANAQRFSWDAMARATHQVYSSLR